MYEWIDPFEEIERERQRARTAYQDGQRGMMRMLEQRDFGPKFRRAVEMLANRVAEKVVAPHMAKSSADHARREYQAEQLRKQFEHDAQGLVEAILASGHLELSQSYKEDGATLSYEVHEPFRVNIGIAG